MSPILRGDSCGPKLFVNHVKRNEKRRLPTASFANFHRAYSDVREWRKNTFPETQKAFLVTPPRESATFPPDNLKEQGNSRMPTLSTGGYACPMLWHSIDGS